MAPHGPTGRHRIGKGLVTLRRSNLPTIKGTISNTSLFIFKYFLSGGSQYTDVNKGPTLLKHRQTITVIEQYNKKVLVIFDLREVPKWWFERTFLHIVTFSSYRFIRSFVLLTTTHFTFGWNQLLKKRLSKRWLYFVYLSKNHKNKSKNIITHSIKKKKSPFFSRLCVSSL